MPSSSLATPESSVYCFWSNQLPGASSLSFILLPLSLKPLTTHASRPSSYCCPLPDACCLLVNRGASIRNHTRGLKKGNKKQFSQERPCLLTCLLMGDPGTVIGP